LHDSDSFFANELESDAEQSASMIPSPHKDGNCRARNRVLAPALRRCHPWRRITMDFSRGALLWLLGVPLPIILLIALFWHH
jgi:hypothetical protein